MAVAGIFLLGAKKMMFKCSHIENCFKCANLCFCQHLTFVRLRLCQDFSYNLVSKLF